jgi:hypothetical protein
MPVCISIRPKITYDYKPDKMSEKSSQDAGRSILNGLSTRNRMNHAHMAPSAAFLRPPTDPAGRSFDVSDRLLICSSSNLRNEIVVGGSDHALYSININDSCAATVTMYSKSYGHTDWVSSVTHLVDGKV